MYRQKSGAIAAQKQHTRCYRIRGQSRRLEMHTTQPSTATQGVTVIRQQVVSGAGAAIKEGMARVSNPLRTHMFWSKASGRMHPVVLALLRGHCCTGTAERR